MDNQFEAVGDLQFRKMAVRWCRTVVSLMAKRSAICLLRKPSPTSVITSRSRSVRVAILAPSRSTAGPDGRA